MAERNPEVMRMVEESVKSGEEISATALKSRAEGIDPAIAELSQRQFHGQYPLQVKRALARAAGGGARRRGAGKKAVAKKAAAKRGAAKRGGRGAAARGDAAETPTTGTGRGRGRGAGAGNGASRDPREAIRGVLMEFAAAVAEAESRAGIVRVLGELDRYVDRIARAGEGRSR